jgi:hypothetical protein
MAEEEIAANMKKKGIEFLGSSKDARKEWIDRYGIKSDEEMVITYGLLRHGSGERSGEAVLRNWPESPSQVAVKWDDNIMQIMNVEVKGSGIKEAVHSPGKAVPGRGDIEILRIAGPKRDVEQYRKNLDSMEHGYNAVRIPVYRQNEDKTVSKQGEAVLYMKGGCPKIEAPEKLGSVKELYAKLKTPFAILKTSASGSNWYLGRKGRLFEKKEK